MLTTRDVAALKGCSKQNVLALIKRNDIQCECIQTANGRPQFLIPLTALDAKEQARYHKQHETGGQVIELPQRQNKPLDSYSRHEREQIHFWITLLDEWQAYRNKPIHASRAAADETFITYALVKYLDEYQSLYDRPFALGTDTLYRRWRAYKDQDYDGFIEKRGKALKGSTSMQEIIWDAFLSYYLDQAQHPINKCYKYTKLWLQEERPDLLSTLPSYSAFYRRVQNDIPEPLKVLGREGEKAYRDRCAPYIRRVYDDMESNDYWIADTHTFDVMSANEEGKTRRLYLTAFFDARSGIFTGCTITETPGSQAVLNALRKGIFKYGIPNYIYVDNGREFLTHDIGGLGHRKKKSNADVFEPPGVFKRLGITMINALVRNARAKVIERRFLDVKNDFSRLFATFTGGNVLEKPEQLSANLKKGKAPTDAELIETAELLLDWYFNQQEYHGAVAADHGKKRMQVYLENLHTKRVAAEDDLNLMLMRSSRKQTVGRRGIHHTVGGTKIDYFNDALVNTKFGQEVYYRYDPDDLSSVRLYDLDDRFLMSVPTDNDAILTYHSNQEEIKLAQSKVRRIEKTAKEALKNSGLAAYSRKDALSLVISEAKRNSTAFIAPEIQHQVLRLERVNEVPMLENAVGFDIDTMIQNAERHHKGGSDNE